MESLNICPKCGVVIGQYGQCNCNSRHRWVAGLLGALLVALLIVPGAMAVVVPPLDNPSCTVQAGFEVCSEWQTVDGLTTITYTVTEFNPVNEVSHFTVSAQACPVAASYTTQPPATTANPALDPTTGLTGFKWEDFDVNFGAEPVTLTVSSSNVLPEPGTVAVKAGAGFTLFPAWVFGCTVPEPTATSTNTPEESTPTPTCTPTPTIPSSATHTPTVTATRTPTATPTPLPLPEPVTMLDITSQCEPNIAVTTISNVGAYVSRQLVVILTDLRTDESTKQIVESLAPGEVVEIRTSWNEDYWLEVYEADGLDDSGLPTFAMLLEYDIEGEACYVPTDLPVAPEPPLFQILRRVWLPMVGG